MQKPLLAFSLLAVTYIKAQLTVALSGGNKKATVFDKFRYNKKQHVI